MAYTDAILFDVLKDAERHDIYSVEDFHEMCEDHTLTDYDGFGHPIKNGYRDPSHFIVPSQRHKIPDDVTHIQWYNK
jgi:hypothetical protein